MNAGQLLLLLVLEGFFRSSPFWIGNTDVALQAYPQSFILPLAIWLFLNKQSDRKRVKSTTVSPTTLSTSTLVSTEITTTFPESTTMTATLPSCITCEVIQQSCNEFGCTASGSPCASIGTPAPLVCGQLTTQLRCDNFGCTYNAVTSQCGPADREIFCADLNAGACQNSVAMSCCIYNSGTNTCEQAP